MPRIPYRTCSPQCHRQDRDRRICPGADRPGRRDSLHRRNLSRAEGRRASPPCARSPKSPSFPRCWTAGSRPFTRASPAAFSPSAPSPSTCGRSPSTASRASIMVVVSLYEFEKVAAKKDASARRADREYRHRRPDHDPRRGQELAGRGGDHCRRRLRGDHRRAAAQAGGSLSEETHWKLAKKAFATTAAYDRAVSARLAEIPPTGDAAAGYARYSRAAHSGAALRRESAPVGRAVRDRQGRDRRRRAASRQGAFLQQPGGSGCGLAVGSGVRPARIGRSSSTPIRAAARKVRHWPKATAGRSRPIRSRRSAAYWRSTGRSIAKPPRKSPRHSSKRSPPRIIRPTRSIFLPRRRIFACCE